MYNSHKKIMPEGLYAEPGIIKKGHYDQNDKEENIVDIYVSSESLKVYDNPWVESMAPNIPRPAETQHPVENSAKRNHIRIDSVLLGVLCLLLLTGIICLGVRMGKDKDQLREVNTNLRNMCDQLKVRNAQFSKERDALWKKFCEKNPKKSKNLDRSKNP